MCSYQTSVTFAPDESSKTLTLKTRDDWRHIPDATLTAALLEHEKAHRVGPDSKADVTVEDNDTVSTLTLRVIPKKMIEGNGGLTYTVYWADAPEGASLLFWVRVSHNRVWEDPNEGWEHREVSGIPGRPHIKAKDLCREAEGSGKC